MQKHEANKGMIIQGWNVVYSSHILFQPTDLSMKLLHQPEPHVLRGMVQRFKFNPQRPKIKGFTEDVSVLLGLTRINLMLKLFKFLNDCETCMSYDKNL